MTVGAPSIDSVHARKTRPPWPASTETAETPPLAPGRRTGTSRRYSRRCDCGPSSTTVIIEIQPPDPRVEKAPGLGKRERSTPREAANIVANSLIRLRPWPGPILATSGPLEADADAAVDGPRNARLEESTGPVVDDDRARIVTIGEVLSFEKDPDLAPVVARA